MKAGEVILSLLVFGLLVYLAYTLSSQFRSKVDTTVKSLNLGVFSNLRLGNTANVSGSDMTVTSYPIQSNTGGCSS